MSKLDEFKAAAKASPFAANRLLFTWLADDKQRAELYKEARADAPDGILEFKSRADKKLQTWLDAPSEFRQTVFLLTKRNHILRALNCEAYSNDPYKMLGSGTFMLGLSADDAEAQRVLADAFLKIDRRKIRTLAKLAFLSAAAQPLKSRNFDLADFAEQAAARFVGFLFGFEQADHYVLTETMRSAYRGLNYVILGRHFVSKPGMVDDASKNMGMLLTRVAELIDLYRAPIGRDQNDTRDRIKLEQDELRAYVDSRSRTPLADFVPVLKQIADSDKVGEFTGSELAVIVVGLIAGTIGNIQASVCIAVQQFFDNGREFLKKVQDTADISVKDDREYDGDGNEVQKERIADLEAWIWEALRLNPPAAFLPRMATDDIALHDQPGWPPGRKISRGDVVILAMGSAMRDDGVGEVFRPDFRGKPDELIFGVGGKHSCVGQELVMPVVTFLVRQVMALPGLTQALDPKTGDPYRLEKNWGFTCVTYPCEYNRLELLTQSPLIVIMQVKKPIAEHAEKLKLVIKYGAPRIEKKLRDSGHVHFASFIFLENDSKLALYTVYDRDFDAYIEYFARDVGPLFDRIFEHIENAPPMPVDKFPKEFVDTIRRFNNPPAAGYFFSAYPKADVSKITQRYPPENV